MFFREVGWFGRIWMNFKNRPTVTGAIVRPTTSIRQKEHAEWSCIFWIPNCASYIILGEKHLSTPLLRFVWKEFVHISIDCADWSWRFWNSSSMPGYILGGGFNVFFTRKNKGNNPIWRAHMFHSWVVITQLELFMLDKTRTMGQSFHLFPSIHWPCAHLTILNLIFHSTIGLFSNTYV